MYAIETSKFMYRLIRLPYSFFTQRNSGEIIQRLTLAPDIAKSISFSVVNIILLFFSISTFLVIMFLYNFYLTILVAIFYIIVAFINIFFVQKISDLSQSLALEKGKYFGVTTANVSSINTLKSMGAELEAYNKIAGYQTKLSNSTQN